MTSFAGSGIDLILVRHARPEVRPDVPAGVWPLSRAGRADACALGERLRAAFGPLRVVTSGEQKAIETGEAIAGGGVTIDGRFGEQGLGTVPFLPADAFRARAIAHFRRPQDRVLGEESSAEAASRFDAALRDRLAGEHDATPVIVSHGRVLSAWLAMAALPAARDAATGSAEAIWQRLRMPDAFVLRRGDGGWIYEPFGGAEGGG